LKQKDEKSKGKGKGGDRGVNANIKEDSNGQTLVSEGEK